MSLSDAEYYSFVSEGFEHQFSAVEKVRVLGLEGGYACLKVWYDENAHPFDVLEAHGYLRQSGLDYFNSIAQVRDKNPVEYRWIE